MEKKLYTVNVHYEMIHQMQVEAESEDKALKLAAAKFPEEDFCDDDFDSITGTCIVD